MAELVPAIHVFHHAVKTWMPGMEPGVTARDNHRRTQSPQHSRARRSRSLSVPFTPNQAFKRAPRLIAHAKDVRSSPENHAMLNGTAGLWCTNAGHDRAPIVEAIKRQAAELDYAPAFQFSHPKSSSWRAASRRWRPPVSTACSLQSGSEAGRRRASSHAHLS